LSLNFHSLIFFRILDASISGMLQIGQPPLEVVSYALPKMQPAGRQSD
jgi:hypothetical protein